MIEIIARMFEFLREKLQNCTTSDVSAIYIRRTADEEQPD
jgi:transposase-like protein